MSKSLVVVGKIGPAFDGASVYILPSDRPTLHISMHAGTPFQCGAWVIDAMRDLRIIEGAYGDAIDRHLNPPVYWEPKEYPEAFLWEDNEKTW